MEGVMMPLNRNIAKGGSQAMIEVIYDHSEESEQTGEIQGIRLPKNIRQVGTPQGGRRIYVEDYVMTYLNQLAKPGNTYARGAILLGEYKQCEGQGVLFISGALEAQNVEFDLEETEFSNEIWSQIYENVKRFFPDLEVVGWFLSRMGFSTQVNDKITKMHIENFPGRDKTLYMIDSLEEEDAWYLYENNVLKKQSGYYIYYTRNDAMQNYMMTQRNHMVESETDIAERDQNLLNAYRKRLEQRKAPIQEKERKSASFFYVASSLLTVACLALGISAISNYDRLKELEVAFQRIAIMSGEDNLSEDSQMVSGQSKDNGDTPVTNVISVDANVNPVSEADAETEGSTEQVTEGTEAQGVSETEQETQDSTSDTTEAVIATDAPKYYTVKDGDTLSSISFSMYHSILYVDNIMEANDMKNGDDIYAGQTIIIPAIP